MDSGFSILMLIFAGAILLYAAILGATKDEKMLPLRVQISLPKKRGKGYIAKLAKAIALAALAPALAGLVGLWNQMAGLLAFPVGLAGCLWGSTRIMKDEG